MNRSYGVRRPVVSRELEFRNVDDGVAVVLDAELAANLQYDPRCAFIAASRLVEFRPKRGSRRTSRFRS